MELSQFMQFLFSGITVGSIYAMVALSFVIIYNTTELVNFSQGELVMLGGLICVFFFEIIKIPLLASVCLSILMVGFLGGLMEKFGISKARAKDPIILILITLGIGIILKSSALIIWGKDPQYLPSFSGDTPIQLFSASILPQALWVLGISVLIMIGLYIFFKFTMMGQAMLACSINKSAASLMGINAEKIRMLSFVIGAALASLAGILFTPIATTGYQISGMMTVKGFAAATIGGWGKSYAAVVGGLLLGILESLVVGMVSSGYRDAIVLSIFLLMLMIRPNGLFGDKEIL